jgi:hypothetical protein
VGGNGIFYAWGRNGYATVTGITAKWGTQSASGTKLMAADIPGGIDWAFYFTGVAMAPTNVTLTITYFDPTAQPPATKSDDLNYIQCVAC